MQGAFLNVEESRQHIMKCPYCDTYNPATEEYCSNCGGYLGSSPASATVTSSNMPGLGTTSAGSAGQVTSSTTAGGTHTTSGSLAPGGHLQGGRYVIKKILGQGGMGAAVLANDMRVAGKPVVIKELISDNTDPTQLNEDVKNFEREVETLAYIDHPLVPTVTDRFQEGSHYFMVQEFVDGENLEDRLDRTNQPLPEQDALTYASQVLDILDYLEQQKPPIVHRDIKPANIIISTKDKRAHLVDFGIARADSARNVKRKQTSALGTPGYAPPEQYQGNADPRSDLYALGATMHHLLTNRDPRNYPPFTYVPVRTLNAQLSPEVERVVARAVNNDVTQRYQSAAAMKRDVDDILLKRFGVSGNTGSYTLNTSGPIGAAGATGATGAANVFANQPTRVQQTPVTPVPPHPPYQPGAIYSPPPRQSGGTNVGRNLLSFVLVIVLLGAIAFGVLNLRNRGTASGGNASTPTAVPAASGIGVTKAQNGEYIGISDGTFAFDTTRSDGSFKQQAAQSLAQNNTSNAVALWNSGLSTDINDAEARIYVEDQRVLASGNPYITIVVATMLTGDSATVSVGRDNLQGAYVAQEEFNGGFKLPNSVEVRLLIANAGSNQTYTNTVVRQIVQLAKQDKTFVGVMGWPFSGYTGIAIGALSAAQIPMVSQTASSDALTGISHYFFRVAPPNKDQAIVGAKYAEQVLGASKVALFYDPANSYTQSLANAFSTQFTADGNKIVATEQYTVKKPSNFFQLLNDAESHNPDLIYFSGYASDASVLLTDLQAPGQPASLQIMGGDALYELGGYTSSAHGAATRLHFT